MGGHFELLCKALKHGPIRPLLELHDGLGEVAWLVERCHADADIDHEFLIDRSGRHEESPPCLHPDGELHGLQTGRKEITVLANTNTIVGSMVVQHQIVCPHDRGKIVISKLGVPVGKAGTMQSVRETCLRWLFLRIEFAGLEFLGESNRDGIGLVALGGHGLALLEEDRRDLERLGQLLRRNQPGATIMRNEWYVFPPARMCTLLKQCEQTGSDALEVSLGSNLDVVVIDDPRLWEPDREEVDPENPRCAERPETGTVRSRGVVPKLEYLDQRAGSREALINGWGTSEYCISRSPCTWWPSAFTCASSSISTLTTTTIAITSSMGLTATTEMVAAASVGTHDALLECRGAFIEVCSNTYSVFPCAAVVIRSGWDGREDGRLLLDGNAARDSGPPPLRGVRDLRPGSHGCRALLTRGSLSPEITT